MFTTADVNLPRVLDQIRKLSELGRTAEGGVTRPTFGEAHINAMALAAQWMVDAGLEVVADRWGNLLGQTNATPSGRYVLTGSHLDSVPNGGNYDGVLGVLSALEAVRMIAERRLSLSKGLRVVSFIEEEGSRFFGLLGSTLAVGAMSEERLAALADSEGSRFLDVLNNVEFPCPVDTSIDLREQTASFLELHIEQGKRLETAGIPVGIVTSIAGPQWWRVELTGQADHAGATEYADRRDALLAASELALKVREIGTTRFSATARMTVGKLNVQPNVTNIVAGKVILDIDTRLATPAAQEESAQVLAEAIRQIAEQHHLGYTTEKLTTVPPTIAPARIQNAFETACQQANVHYQSLVSWAAHDAMMMARVCDSGMIFVPCRDGRSHCPDEFTRPEDIAVGIAVLANALVQIAAQ